MMAKHLASKMDAFLGEHNTVVPRMTDEVGLMQSPAHLRHACIRQSKRLGESPSREIVFLLKAVHGLTKGHHCRSDSRKAVEAVRSLQIPCRGAHTSSLSFLTLTSSGLARIIE